MLKPFFKCWLFELSSILGIYLLEKEIILVLSYLPLYIRNTYSIALTMKHALLHLSNTYPEMERLILFEKSD